MDIITNLSIEDKERFIKVNKLYLNYIGEDVESLLEYLPNKLHTSTSADILIMLLPRTAVRLKDTNLDAARQVGELLTKFKKLNLDEDGVFESILFEMEEVAEKYQIQ
ncbi:hypothetical protein J23TS9_05830 [Paenibacillus sp. J23TS9]|uniref:hypothetical protein n=1 Tax=Paenibacillus sp. J23TS9 TaxID=2807193 RepID=UPI001B08B3A8|nr:hypothetical protein [Paenibacillus sp. J23TS9]GIP25453.1 hypothetical protein J23TS9_05830 [Paenibacillus sp. J23TS9]